MEVAIFFGIVSSVFGFVQAEGTLPCQKLRSRRHATIIVYDSICHESVALLIPTYPEIVFLASRLCKSSGESELHWHVPHRSLEAWQWFGTLIVMNIGSGATGQF
jgi:hypothetical protein